MSRVAIVSNIDIFKERSRVELVEELAALGHDVMVIAPVDPINAKTMNWPCRWWHWPLVQHAVNPFGELAAAWFLYRLFSREQPDIVLNFRLKAALYGTAAATFAGVPSISTIFTGLGHYFVDQRRIDSFIGRCIRVALRLVLSRNTTVFFQNPDDAALFDRFGLIRGDQGFVVPGSGVDTKEFAPQPKKAPDYRFVLISRLLRDKGIVEFCVAADRIRSHSSDVRFVLIGAAGSEPTALLPSDLEKWTKDGTVEYRGQIADVRPEIAESTAVVLPSYYAEGVPRSLLEALAMGRPIITTDMPGCRLTVEDGVNGYLVPPRDVEALVAVMSKLLGSDNDIERMGRRSRELAIEKFDVEIVVRRLVSRLLQHNIGGHSGSNETPGSSAASTAVDSAR